MISNVVFCHKIVTCRRKIIVVNEKVFGMSSHVSMVRSTWRKLRAKEQATRDHGQYIRIKEDLYGTKSQSVYGKWKNRR
jgi:hypothetical protein